MNRNIKFRVWCKRTKHFTNIPFYSCAGRQLLWLHTGNEISTTNLDDESEYVVQQFTGRLDQNDKPIYEGDICYLDYGLGKFDKENLFEIVFERGCFQLKPIKLSKSSGRGVGGGNNAFTHIVEIQGFDKNGDEIYEYRLPPPRPICNFNIMVVAGNVCENKELLK